MVGLVRGHIILEGRGKAPGNGSSSINLLAAAVCSLEQSDFILREGQDRAALILGKKWEERFEIEMIGNNNLLFKTGRQPIGAKRVWGAEERKPITWVQPK